MYYNILGLSKTRIYEFFGSVLNYNIKVVVNYNILFKFSHNGQNDILQLILGILKVDSHNFKMFFISE